MTGLEFVGKLLSARDEQKRILKGCKDKMSYQFNLGRQSALDDIINWIKQE